MSAPMTGFGMSTNVRGTLSVYRAFGRDADTRPYIQSALNEVREVGLDFLRSHIPIDTTALVSTADAGTNQYSVYFKVALAPDPARPNADYGGFQNYGWHDRAGGWHQGVHFMEQTMAFSGELLSELLGGLVPGQSGAGDFVSGIGGGYIPY